MSTPTVQGTGSIDKEELRAIVAEVLDVDAGEIGDESSFVDDLEVDSLMALEIVVVLEKKYRVKLAERELKQISCLNNAYELMSAKLAGAGS
jgi:acyl carrier protein